MPGVKSLEVLVASEGSPRYCLILETEDEHDSAVAARIEAMHRDYAGFHSSYSNRAFRSVG